MSAQFFLFRDIAEWCFDAWKAYKATIIEMTVQSELTSLENSQIAGHSTIGSPEEDIRRDKMKVASTGYHLHEFWKWYRQSNFIEISIRSRLAGFQYGDSFR